MKTEFANKYITLGLKIAYYRKKAGYTQETFAELIDAFSQSTFDAQTGLYTCDELDIDGGENTYYNLKMGFIDGKLAYVYYEEKTEGGMKPIYQCYLEYKTVEVTLPTVDE